MKNLKKVYFIYMKRAALLILEVQSYTNIFRKYSDNKSLVAPFHPTRVVEKGHKKFK